MSSVSHSFIMSKLACVPSHPTDPVTNGRSSGTAALPSSAFADAGAEKVGDCDDFISRVHRAGADEDRDALPRIQHCCGALELRLLRQHARRE